MSTSGISDEFSYQTRLVVYNFLGLVPATPSQSEDETETAQPERVNPTSPWNETLDSLPPVSLIDRLNESEERQQNMKMVLDEVVNRAKTDESSSETQPKLKEERNVNDLKCKKKSVDPEEAHRAVLSELHEFTFPRGHSPNDLSNEEPQTLTPITVIQKRNKLKILGDAVTASEEADIRRRMSLQPVSTSAPFHRVSIQPTPLSAAAGSFGSRPPFPRRPTNLFTTFAAGDQSLTSSREQLTQIDEEPSALDDENHPTEISSQNQNVPLSTVPAQHLAPKSSVALTPISVERQNSSWSSASRRCSAYVDITEVDVENLVKTKALPPVTLPLKRALSVAFEELEKTYPTGDDEEDGLRCPDDRSPESTVADSLRALGDRIQEEYGSRLNFVVRDLLGSMPSPSVDYTTIRDATQDLVQQTPNGWTRVTLVMLIGQHLIYELLQRGYNRISHVTEYTAQLIEDHTADFIINSGGWNSISDIGVTETEVLQSPLDEDGKLVFDSTDCSRELAVKKSNVPEVKNEPPLDPELSLTTRKTVVPPVLEVSSRQSKDCPDNDCPGNDCTDNDCPGDDCPGDDCPDNDCPDKDCSLRSNDHLPDDLEHDHSALDTTSPLNQSIEGEIQLLRQNSQQYMEDVESARRTIFWTQSSAVAGLLLMTLFVSWVIYRRSRRVA